MPDGTTAQADATLSQGESETPQTISWEEHQKALRDATSAIKADIGRERAESKKALEAAQAAQARLDKMIRDQEAAELDAVRDEPEKLSAVQERQRRRATESELAAVRLELTDKTAKLTQHESRAAETARETKAREIAARLNVDPARVIKLSKFTDGSPEAIEEIASELPKLQAETPGLRPDSNRSVGGSIQTVTDVRKNFVAGKITNVQYAEKMRALGANP